VSVPIGPWLPVCTTLLALFLILSKRRHELVLLGEGAITHRPILEEYSPYLLDQMIAVVTASTVIAYGVFCTSTETAQRLGTARLGLTIPFVLYGIFRYLYLVHQKSGGGSPYHDIAYRRSAARLRGPLGRRRGPGALFAIGTLMPTTIDTPAPVETPSRMRTARVAVVRTRPRRCSRTTRGSWIWRGIATRCRATGTRW
jgi:hypothetical protein